ncbi:kunitz-type protease inhibitor 1a [Paramormyrops kingsleyae]|uniref:Serine peptidase inhibitor, Kunitz type 1 a n=1 Tax=Paramormyrops kingsleyae TaxID=1676925 RepID=A0A3B3RJM0_9TELE|nr:kunitz-type protease inhibitor 1 [Paramormyrops kingsleyae]
MISSQVWLLWSVLLLLRSPSLRADTFGEQCLDNFQRGEEDFVLDTDLSVKEGATFIASPTVTGAKDCVRSCCKDPRCNLALMEDEADEGMIKACFLFDCVYKQTYVCKMARKKGFSNYILKTVFDEYLKGPSGSQQDRPPIARVGPDKVVQPDEDVLLQGIESMDDHRIETYEWTLISGDSSMVMEKKLPDQVMVSNLSSGVYKFQLMVTDSAGQSSKAVVTVLVLTKAQSENHCLVPKKVGPCRGSFPRWHYNAASERCEQFVFGGCKGNNNNYVSKNECEDACKSAVSTHSSRGVLRPSSKGEVCGSPCRPDQFTCSNGCCLDKGQECDKETQCSDGSDEASCDNLEKNFEILLHIPIDEVKVRCTEPPKTGPCRSSLTLWYYDPLTRKCFRFNYGGCDGNNNRFEVEETCMNTCQVVSEKDVYARGTFEYQEAQTTQAAGIAIAVLLGVAILILLSILGYCVMKGKREQAPRHQRVAVNGTHTLATEDMERLVYNTTTKPI